MTLYSSERGDTLIEVLIAISVLSIVLISLYSLMTDAFKLSIQSQDRSQATNYIKIQSEGLRALRDSNSWSDFTGMLPSSGTDFHLERVGDNWAINTSEANYDGRFNISVRRQLTTDSDEEAFLISADWARIGGGTDTSRAEFKLANLEFDEFPVGNSSGTSTAPTSPPGPAPGAGVCGYYYTNQTQNADPPPTNPFTGAAQVRYDSAINFDWGAGAPPGVTSENFSVQWIGELQIDTPGNYTFYTTSDDGVRLRINGNTVIDQWYRHSPTEHSGTIFLTPGRKSLEMDLYEHTGQAVGELRWQNSSVGIPKQIVPTNNLYSDPSNPNCN